MSSLYPPIVRGATGTNNGAAGLVPAVVIADRNKFYRGDGTFQTISGGGDALTSGSLSQFASTSSLELRGVISDKTGTGALVFAGGNIGAATATSLNGLTITSSTGTLTITNGKTFAVSNSLTATATDGSTVAFGAGGTVLYSGGALGTPATGTLTNCTGLPTAGLVDDAVTYAKMQNVSAASKLLGRGDSGSGDTQEITIGSGLSMSGTTLSATGGGTGDVTAASNFGTDNRLIRSDGTTKGVQSSAITVDDSGNITGVADISVTSLSFTTMTGTVPVTNGGTGRATSTTAYGLIAAGTTATGVQQTMPAGATTEILVGGGASSLPVWTTATGTGAPVRATSPTLVTPALGTPSSGNLSNCTSLPASAISAAVLGGNITLGESSGQVYLDPALSADGTWSGICETGTAGATLAFGNLCYLDPTDSRWELTAANSAAGADGDARGKLGICVQAAASDGSATTMLLWGKVRADAAFPSMTINNPLYVSETAGAITGTQPTTTDVVIRVIGVANTGDELFFRPDFVYITHT